MQDLTARFERDFYLEKNPDLMELVLSRILNISSEFVTISTFSDGKIIFMNDAFLTSAGWQKEDVIGRTVSELNLYVDPSQRTELQRTLTDGELLESEVNFRGKDGKVYCYLLKIQTIDLYGEDCILTIGWDITRRQELEQQLHTALKSNLRQTVQALDNMVFKLDLGPDGRLTYDLSEGKIARNMGLTTDLIYGRSAAELYTQAAMEIIEPHFMKTLAGETTSFEIEVGDRVLIKSLSPYFENDKITGIVGSAIDITERKKLEKLLQVSELNSIVGQLAAGAAHEIRNPLTSIKGFVQLIGEILEKNGIDKGRDYVDLILSELSRINHLVSEMLWLRKPKESVFETVNVSTLLQEVLPLVLMEANLKSIQVTLQLSSKSSKVKANLDLLKQVILNICKNGIEAMEDGGSLSISACHDDTEVAISVRDTGPGIPIDVEDKIFTPFFTTKDEGNGLGLFISKQIVHDMDGEITLSSDSEGTVVRLAFPLAD